MKQIIVIKKGYIYKPYLKLKDEDLKQTLYVIAPILLGMSVSQINKIIDRSLASTFVEGGLSALTYGSFINTAISEVLVTGIITILFSKWLIVVSTVAESVADREILATYRQRWQIELLFKRCKTLLGLKKCLFLRLSTKLSSFSFGALLFSLFPPSSLSAFLPRIS